MQAVTEAGHVLLHGGYSIPLPALQLLWELEGRGFTLYVDAGSLVVTPRSQLSASDDEAIRRHRDALIVVVLYCERLAEREH